MTLAVSLRVPDGLIIAADSLTTTMGQIGISAEVGSRCPKCHEDIKLKDVSLPPIPIPASVSSFGQKVFPFLNKHYGIATFGMAILNEKTIYYHVKVLESEYQDKKILNMAEISKVLEKYFDKELRRQVRDIDKAPPGYSPLGFLITGYDGKEGKTILLKIGKESKVEEYTGSGCTISGDTQVVTKLWELGKSEPRRGTKYASFSLQDAVDYAEYLVYSTANFQRFANMIPTVGGEVDIGLITPFREFTWIKCKSLTKDLEK